MAKKDYVVLNARLGSSEGGMACGPVGGADVGEIEFIEEHDYRAVGQSQYMAFVLVDGILNPILSDKSLFDELIQDDLSEETIDYVNAHTIPAFDGIDMDEDLDSLRMSLTGTRSPAAKLLRKMCSLMRLLGRE